MLFNWLHLSDWHEGQPEFDRKVVLDSLIKDITNRKLISSDLEKINAVIFSGDIAYSGKKEQYESVNKTLIRPIKRILGENVKFVFAPGNHDLDRDDLKKIPKQWLERMSSLNNAGYSDSFRDLVTREGAYSNVLAPFKNFYNFVGQNGFRNSNDSPVCFYKFKLGSKNIAIIAINSAINSSMHKIKSDYRSDLSEFIWDYGTLIITEDQIRDAIGKSEGCDFKILVLHHPISWINPNDQPQIEQLIARNFDILIHGHEHVPRFSSIENNISSLKIIPAGATFDKRKPNNPRYVSSINFSSINTDTREGVVFNRRWSDQNDRWIADETHSYSGITRFVMRSKSEFEDRSRHWASTIQKKYNRYFDVRPAKTVDITIRHDPVSIDSHNLIQSKIQYKLDLYTGKPEKFPVRTILDSRLCNSVSEVVREKVYLFESFVGGKSTMIPESDGHNKMIGDVEIGSEETSIDYKYNILECENGIWYFSLRRFVDVVNIKFVKAQGYDYEILSIGGFPELKLIENDMLNYYAINSSNGHMPYEGLIIQWYKSKN